MPELFNMLNTTVEDMIVHDIDCGGGGIAYGLTYSVVEISFLCRRLKFMNVYFRLLFYMGLIFDLLL